MDRKAERKAVVHPAPDTLGLELDARRLGRVRTVEILQAGRTPLKVLEVAEQGPAILESGLQQAHAAQRPPTLACKEGCDWCCHLRVGTSVPEAARIAAHLRQTLSPADLQAVRERVARLAEQRRELKMARRTSEPLPCAFLVDHRCSIYPVRPLTCRGSNSTDARACERFLSRPRQTVIPNYAPQHRLAAFVLDGIRAGASEVGLKGDLLELAGAVRIALEVPDAVTRWLAGEAVFTPARLD
jgi:Fe-S-cluster containining protein